MKNKIWMLSLSLSLILILSLVACNGGGNAPASPAPSGDGEPSYTGSALIATGSATGNYYAFASAITGVINPVLGSSITVTASGGSTENARLLASGEAEMSLIQTDVASFAYNGTEIFEGDKIDNFYAVTTCYPEMVQIVVRKDANIKTVEDLRGKNICPGAIGSGYEVACRNILAAYGMSYDDVNANFMDQSNASAALQDGQIDCMFLCSGYPNGNVTELSLTGKVEMLSLDQEHLEMILAANPYYVSFPVEDAYEMGQDIEAVAVMSMMVVNESFSDDEVYAITKAIWENLDDVLMVNAKAEYMKIETALDGIPCEVHPGAMRYYKERGVA